jgi:ESS family glutamate:Na+ symporter
LLAGPLAEWLLRRRGNTAPGPASVPLETPAAVASFFGDLRALGALGRGAVGHALLIAACVKAGAWVSFGLDRAGASLPAYMGALLVGFAVRAAHDAAGGTWLRGEVIARLAAVLLPLFLAVTLAALNLAELAAVAGPMLVILVVNTLVSLAFAAWVVWPLLGRDHEAGVMVAGLVGFGVGSTATAVAAMDAITRRRGPAPRAVALVPPTGGFLIDFTNAPVISAFLQLLR